MNLNFLIQRLTGRNADYLVQRMVGRATCRLDAGSVLGVSARIRNICGDTDKIAIGAQSQILGELMTFAHGGEIRIGEWCFVGEGTRIWSAASIEIGKPGSDLSFSEYLRQSDPSDRGGRAACAGP
ncbi:LbetaH domain-containing protein [Bradyrhizobium diazoefficiens]|uniref:hypothetical protein n=1 Tax=Bradyrhizobium diazoefficiens TaxID=1355477 RepID=UPI003835A280